MNIGDKVKILKKKQCAGAWRDRCGYDNGCKGCIGEVFKAGDVTMSGEVLEIKLDKIFYDDRTYVCKYFLKDVELLGSKELL